MRVLLLQRLETKRNFTRKIAALVKQKLALMFGNVLSGAVLSGTKVVTMCLLRTAIRLPIKLLESVALPVTNSEVLRI
ncbi:MAG: hypothetical protein KAS75_07385 [Planctomycetes bacterium]|nr:hypothetical protein [Planctomycetota bacterium]